MIPGNANPLLLATAADAAAAAGPIKSLRFNSGDTAYLSKDFGSAGDRRTWTVSFWIKKVKNDSGANFYRIFGQENATHLYFYQDNINFDISNSGTTIGRRWTSQVFRDNSAWFHVVAVCNTPASTASERMRLYINGSEVTDFGNTTDPSQNADTAMNTANQHTIGYRTSTQGSAGGALDAYIADFYFIDGSALDPTSFGAFDDSGVWQAAAYSGTFGTNGFHLLDFANESTVGHDSSGNENDFTANNISGSENPVYSRTAASSITNPANIFDGSTSTGGYSSSTGTNITLTTSTFTISTQLRVYNNFRSDGTYAICLNGTCVAVAGSGTDSTQYRYSTVDLSSFTLPLTVTSLGYSASQTSGNTLRAIEVDSTVLVDGTPSNLDVLFDVPTNGTQSDTGAGGEVSGNYCIGNPIHPNLDASPVTLSNGNLDGDITSGSNWYTGQCTIGVSSGKWYFEQTVHSGYAMIGIAAVTADFTANSHSIGSVADGIGYFNGNGNKYTNSTNAAYGATYGNGDIVGCAFDMDARTVTFYKNGVSQGQLTSAITAGVAYAPCFSLNGQNGAGSYSWNFGQRPFAYSAPSGFSPICTTLLPTPTIADGSAQFDTKLWTGDGTQARAITSLNYSPDLVWLKRRDAGSSSNQLHDAVRGASAGALYSDLTNTEDSNYDLTSLDSNGFTLGTVPNLQSVNASGGTYVAWAWNAGANSNKTYTVTVVSDSGNKYRFDGHGTSAVTLDLAEGSTYVFDQSDSSNSGHPLRFSTTSDGTHNSGSEYTTGVTTTGTPGSAGAKTTIVVASGAPTLFYYCSSHSGMGGQANTNSTAGSTRLSGSKNTERYNQDQNWGPGSTITGSWAFSDSVDNAFDGDLTTVSRAAASQATTINLPADVAFTSSVKLTGSLDLAGGQIYVKDGTNAFVNVSSGFNTSSTVNTVDITSLLTSPIKEIKLDSVGNGYCRMSGIEVDGKILASSSATPPAFPSINSVVKANPEAGFSIVTYTGNATSGATIGHGLNAATPQLILIKRRDAVKDWIVYHSALGNSAYVRLNTTDAQSTGSLVWAQTDPTSSVFSVGGSTSNNASGGTYVAYCFAPVAGHSAISEYSGSGSSGNFIYLGFRPAFLMIKSTSAYGWAIIDSKRSSYNVDVATLYPNKSDAEFTGSGHEVDFLSNGFNLRNSNNRFNRSGSDYIYLAFAENSFQANGGLAR